MLYYPQKSLVSTVASRVSKFDDLPAGVNVICAIGCILPEETVLMADGTRKKIRDVVVGDEVVSFDPLTCEEE